MNREQTEAWARTLKVGDKIQLRPDFGAALLGEKPSANLLSTMLQYLVNKEITITGMSPSLLDPLRLNLNFDFQHSLTGLYAARFMPLPKGKITLNTRKNY